MQVTTETLSPNLLLTGGLSDYPAIVSVYFHTNISRDDGVAEVFIGYQGSITSHQSSK